MSKKIYSFFLLFMIISNNTYSKKLEYSGSCKFQGYMDRLITCLDKELENYDKELNLLYKKEFDRFRNNRLKNTELIWIKFREADCEYIAYEVNEGLQFPIIYKICMINKTKIRIADLKRSVFYIDWISK
ncbi:MAG: lysozyme inhibitor LprI family protein [Legionella sp.]|nr:lysozyme inhibitor LprI family protein [Legionella sp.]